MKFNKVSALCALACAGFAGHASAVTANAVIADAQLNSRTVFISGASAVQKGFDTLVSTLFTAGTTYYFGDSADGTKSNFVAVAGQLASTIGTWPAGSNVIIQYRTLGGSGFGVFPTARNTAIPFMNVTAANCTNSLSASNTLTTAVVCGANPATAGQTVSVAPDAGIADADPTKDMFDGQANTYGEVAIAPLSATEKATLTATQMYALAFGIPVTNNVPASVSFNKSLLSSILSGNVGTWDQVDASLPAEDIVICRRTPGSGTQVIANVAFGGYPCMNGAGRGSVLPADRSSNPYWDASTGNYTFDATPQGGVLVVENDTSGDLKNCLAAAATGGSFTTHNRDGDLTKTVSVNFGGVARKAIGLLSMDSLSGSTTAATGWSFRAMNGAGTYTYSATAPQLGVASAGATGVLPTYTDFINGNWEMQGQETFLVPARTTGEKKTVVNTILANALKPSVLTSLAALKYVAGTYPAVGTGVPTAANVVRATFQNGDMCQPLQRNN